MAGNLDMTNIQTRGVIAGCYRGARASLKQLLTHAILVDDAGRDMMVRCGRIPLGNVVDAGGREPDGTLPTCPRCLSKLRADSKRPPPERVFVVVDRSGVFSHTAHETRKAARDDAARSAAAWMVYEDRGPFHVVEYVRVNASEERGEHDERRDERCKRHEEPGHTSALAAGADAAGSMRRRILRLHPRAARRDARCKDDAAAYRAKTGIETCVDCGGTGRRST